MRYQIELTHSKPIITAVIRNRVPAKELAQFVPAACGEVWSFIRSAGLPRPGRHLTLYSDAHAAIREWCVRHGHRCSGVSWEIYGHWEESWNTDSSKIRTDVFYLLHDPK